MHQKQRAVGGSENLEGEDFDFIPSKIMGGGAIAPFVPTAL